MIRIIHVSDLHFGSKKGDGARPLLTTLLTDFSNRTDYLLVTGDITDDGDAKQFAEAREALGPFAKGERLLVAPGNHDYGHDGNWYDRRRAEAFSEWARSLGIEERFIENRPVARLLCDGNDTTVLAVGLNTNLQTQEIGDFACGEVGRAQLDLLGATLGAVPANAHKVVFLHHRPMSWWNPFIGMHDGPELMRLLGSQGVCAVAFGHTGGGLAKTKRTQEPPAATTVEVREHVESRPQPPEEAGRRSRDEVRYRLNANAAVAKQKFNVIEFDGRRVTASSPFRPLR